MSDSNDAPKSMDASFNFCRILGGLNIFVGILAVFINAFDYDTFKSSFYAIFIVEGLLFIICSYILFRDKNYNTLLFIPIIAGIITIVLGSRYVYSRTISNDFGLVASALEVIIGGMLLIITSFALIKGIGYKKIIYISLLFVVINIIIKFVYFKYESRYNNYNTNIITNIPLFMNIFILFMSVIIIIIRKRSDYKFLIFIPVLFGTQNIGFGIARMIIKNNAFYTENNDVVRLGVIIYSGILLFILLLRIIDRYTDKILLFITVPFAILNLLYGLYSIIVPLIWYGYYAIDFYIVSVILAEGIVLCIISKRLNDKFTKIPDDANFMLDNN